MDRLQKKCFVASVAMHLLLLILLFVSPAFMTPEEKVEHLPILTFIPSMLVDDPVSGGGSPKPPAREVKPERPKPAPQGQEITPPPPAPRPKPKPVQPKPEPPKKVVQAPEPKPEPKKQVKPRRIITPTFTKSSDDSKRREQEKAQIEEAKRLQSERARLRDQIAKVNQSLSTKLSSSTTIQPIGSGGPAYANYAQVVKAMYERAWNPPPELEGDLGTVKVEVVIKRNGNVTSARIKRGSGNLKLDQSVKRALQIKHIAPFPKGIRDLQRTFIIDFNLKAKRFTG